MSPSRLTVSPAGVSYRHATSPPAGQPDLPRCNPARARRSDGERRRHRRRTGRGGDLPRAPRRLWPLDRGGRLRRGLGARRCPRRLAALFRRPLGPHRVRLDLRLRRPMGLGRISLRQLGLCRRLRLGLDPGPRLGASLGDLAVWWRLCRLGSGAAHRISGSGNRNQLSGLGGRAGGAFHPANRDGRGERQCLGGICRPRPTAGGAGGGGRRRGGQSGPAPASGRRGGRRPGAAGLGARRRERRHPLHRHGRQGTRGARSGRPRHEEPLEPAQCLGRPRADRGAAAGHLGRARAAGPGRQRRPARATPAAA